MKRRQAKKVFLNMLWERAEYRRSTRERCLRKITVGDVMLRWRFDIRAAQPMEPIRPGAVRL